MKAHLEPRHVTPTSDIRVATLERAHEDAYNQFVASHPHALVFYTLRYRDFLCELLGCHPRYAVAWQRERIVGVMPLMEMDGLCGRVLNSMPYFGSNGGPLVTDPAAHPALISWYHEQLYDDGTAAGTLVTNPLAVDRDPPDHDFVETRVGHVTSLPPDPSEAALLAAVDKSRRWDIKKAERLGTRVAIENDAIATLRDMHGESMKAIGAEAKSQAFFSALPRHFRAEVDYDIFVARTGDGPVAALLVFYTAQSADYFMPAVPPAARTGQPLALILKTAMLHAVDRGGRRWNWGGSPASHTTLQRFKAKWGGKPHTYRFWTKVNDPGLLSATPARLRSGYPGFFVLPYDRLHNHAESTSTMRSEARPSHI